MGTFHVSYQTGTDREERAGDFGARHWVSGRLRGLAVPAAGVLAAEACPRLLGNEECPHYAWMRKAYSSRMPMNTE
jgi:hypothetical protein